MRYPTIEGLPISTHELNLPPSRLDLESPRSYNNHHLEYTARFFGRFLLTKSLRDLEWMQEIIPIDTHTEIHKRYEPPQAPTPEQAMGRVALAFDMGEQMKVWDMSQKKYVMHKITPVLMTQIKREFDTIR